MANADGWVCRGITSLAAASAAEGPAFIAVGAGGRVVQLQAATGAVQTSWQGGRHALTAVAAAAAASRVVLSSATVTVWDTAEQKRLFKFSGHAVSPDHQTGLELNGTTDDLSSCAADDFMLLAGCRHR